MVMAHLRPLRRRHLCAVPCGTVPGAGTAADESSTVTRVSRDSGMYSGFSLCPALSESRTYQPPSLVFVSYRSLFGSASLCPVRLLTIQPRPVSAVSYPVPSPIQSPFITYPISPAVPFRNPSHLVLSGFQSYPVLPFRLILLRPARYGTGRRLVACSVYSSAHYRDVCDNSPASPLRDKRPHVPIDTVRLTDR